MCARLNKHGRILWIYCNNIIILYRYNRCRTGVVNTVYTLTIFQRAAVRVSVINNIVITSSELTYNILGYRCDDDDDDDDDHGDGGGFHSIALAYGVMVWYFRTRASNHSNRRYNINIITCAPHAHTTLAHANTLCA